VTEENYSSNHENIRGEGSILDLNSWPHIVGKDLLVVVVG